LSVLESLSSKNAGKDAGATRENPHDYLLATIC
jgi:hypothetical protein